MLKLSLIGVNRFMKNDYYEKIKNIDIMLSLLIGKSDSISILRETSGGN